MDPNMLRDVKWVLGRTVKAAEIKNNALILRFVDGSGVRIFDDGQQCCELRYLHTDDDVSSLVGAKVLDICEKDGTNVDEEGGDVHETTFIEIQTNKGFVLLVNHNEHNGCYSGFAVAIEEEELE